MDILIDILRFGALAALLAWLIRIATRRENSDLVYLFFRSPLAVGSTLVFLSLVIAATFADYLGTQDPYDPKTIEPGRSLLRPVWDPLPAPTPPPATTAPAPAATPLNPFAAPAPTPAPTATPLNPFANAGATSVGGSSLNPFGTPEPTAHDPRIDPRYPLGSDDKGRDVLTYLMYGTRLSLVIGLASVGFAMVLGVALGLISGYVGGRTDSIIMRIADVQLSFPAILIALLVDGIAPTVIEQIIGEPLSNSAQNSLAIYVIIFAIGLSTWVQYARTVRGSVLVEKGKEYVQAAQVIGIRPLTIIARHILPNVMGPVLVIATINLAVAIITEATLSFLGVGLPPTEPSLGTMIRKGNDEIFSGVYWLILFPGLALVLLSLSVNLLGDWLRDALNPKLR